MRTGILSVLGGAVVFGMGAMAASLKAPPTTVAIVDIAQVINTMDEMQAVNDELTLMKAEYDELLQQSLDKIAKTEDDMNALVAGSAQFLEKGREMIFARSEMLSKRESMLLAIDLHRSARLAEIYWKIRDEIKVMADGQYDLVMIRNELETFKYADGSSVPRSMQVQQQISTHPMVFIDDAIDVTDELVQRLNNNFKLGP